VPYLPQNGLQQHPGEAVGTVWLLSCSAGLALLGVSCRGSCTAGNLPAFGAGLAADLMGTRFLCVLLVSTVAGV